MRSSASRTRTDTRATDDSAAAELPSPSCARAENTLREANELLASYTHRRFDGQLELWRSFEVDATGDRQHWAPVVGKSQQILRRINTISMQEDIAKFTYCKLISTISMLPSHFNERQTLSLQYSYNESRFDPKSYGVTDPVLSLASNRVANVAIRAGLVGVDGENVRLGTHHRANR